MNQPNAHTISDTVHHAPGDDSSQDPAQPAVGPSIQFENLVVPDDQPGYVVQASGPMGELIDERRAEARRNRDGTVG